MKIRNLTPHPVSLIVNTYEEDSDDFVYVLDVDGPAPRVTTDEDNIGHLHIRDEENDRDVYVPLFCHVKSNTVTDLPPEEFETFLIVSRLTAEAVPHRHDLVFPDGIVRDENGQIIGCTKLGRICPV